MSDVNPSELVDVLRQSAATSERLLRENEELRAQIARLQKASQTESAAQSQDDSAFDWQAVAPEVTARLVSLERENREFAARYVEIEEENNNLANLYVASYQLHSTLDFREVLRIITEIAINLIGAEEFAIFLLDEKTQTLSAVAAEGLSREVLPKIALGSDGIGRIAETGENLFPVGEENDEAASPMRRHEYPDLSHPYIGIPLKIKDRVIGVIAIYRFLKQKAKLASVDYELFTLLAGHAATALFSSKLYSESERKLTTIQGFLELMTS